MKKWIIGAVITAVAVVGFFIYRVCTGEQYSFSNQRRK